MPRCKLLKFLPILVLVLLAACNRDPKVLAQRALENGNKFFAKEKYREAAIMYKRALQKDMRDGEAYYRLALTELKLRNYGEALKGLRRAVELQPANTDAITKLADLYLLASTQNQAQSQQLLGEVKDLSDKLIKLNPDSYDGHRLKGQLALLAKKPADAVKEFEQANKVKPNQTDLVLVYFEALVLTDQFPEAEKLAYKLIAAQKAYSPIYDLLYVQYAKRNNIPAAEALLKLKVANNPTQARYLVQLAGHYLVTGDKAGMQSVMQQLSDEKRYPEGHLLAGDFYFFRLRDAENGRLQYEAGMKAFPKDKALYEKRLVELYARTGKSQQSNDMLAQILKDNPHDNDAIAYRAALMLTTGNREQINGAATDLQALVLKNPDNHLYHYDYARALVAKGQVDAAVLQLQEAIKLRADFVAAMELLARIYMAKGDAPNALKQAEAIIAIDKGNLQAHLIRSAALLRMGDKERARGELAVITKAFPNNAEARFQQGMLAYQDKDFKKAESIFTEMYKEAPTDTRGLAGLTESLAAEGRIADAIKATQDAIDKEPKRADLKMVLANYYVRAGRYDDGIAIFQTLLQQDPRSPVLLTKLGETERLKGDMNSAADYFRKCSQANPSDPKCLTQVGLIFEAKGQPEQAKPVWEQILKIAPDDPVALNNLAFIKAQEGVDLDQALTMSQKARQEKPNSPEISDTLGWIYVKKNLSEDAVRIFKDLTAQDPHNAMFHYHYGVALLQKGDRPAAKKELETALADKPSMGDAAKIKDLLQKN